MGRVGSRGGKPENEMSAKRVTLLGRLPHSCHCSPLESSRSFVLSLGVKTGAVDWIAPKRFYALTCSILATIPSTTLFLAGFRSRAILASYIQVKLGLALVILFNRYPARNYSVIH